MRGKSRTALTVARRLGNVISFTAPAEPGQSLARRRDRRVSVLEHRAEAGAIWSIKYLDPGGARWNASPVMSSSPIRSRQPASLQNTCRAEIYSTPRASLNRLIGADQRGAFRQQMAGAPVISGNGIGKAAGPIRHTSENHDAFDPARMPRSKAAIRRDRTPPKGRERARCPDGFQPTISER